MDKEILLLIFLLTLISTMLMRANSGEDTCLCLVDHGDKSTWIQCGNPSCTSPWWHRSCANVSSFSEREIKRMDFVCPLCIISNKKFEHNLKVVNRQQNEVETPHTSLQTASTSVQNVESEENGNVVCRQQNEVETAHTSLPAPLSTISDKLEKAAKKQLPVVEMPHSSLQTSQTLPATNPVVASTVMTGNADNETIPLQNSGRIKQGIAQNVKNPVCNYYRKGICRHGSSGKTLWNGLTCKFSHPKKCNKFCKYGYHPFMGCHDQHCKLLHPILCNNSIDEKRCLVQGCVFQHLQGTERPNQFRTNRSSRSGKERSSRYASEGLYPFRSGQDNKLSRISTNAQQSHNVQLSNGRRNEQTSQLHAPSSVNHGNFTGQHDYRYKREDFPPLPSSEERMTSFKLIQMCLDYLMSCNNAHPQHSAVENNLHLASNAQIFPTKSSLPTVYPQVQVNGANQTLPTTVNIKN